VSSSGVRFGSPPLTGAFDLIGEFQGGYQKTRNVSDEDVARDAGVCSRPCHMLIPAVQDFGGTSEIKIFAIARKIGYPGPNALGRSLRSGKSVPIGVMMMDKPVLAFEIRR